MSVRRLTTSLLRSRLGLVLLVLVVLIGTTFAFLNMAHAAGGLTVDIIAAYNLVVDSNVTSESTYAPSVATVIGKVCNNSGGPLTDVQAYIGDGTTPGTYPSKDSSTFDSTHPLYNTGSYSFTHVGGRIGAKDASRFIGTLADGECQVQYWHFTYPQCANSEEPPCSGAPVWGDSVKPEDDLSLSFDIWADAAGGVSGSASHTMTMRNEISAMANKIEPNPSGRWFNTNSSTVQPGDVITSNGVLYDLGNINKGFDNDGDYVYDYNAWMQPVGDPNYDPSCFRLIRTTGLVTVSRSSGKPDMVIPFRDNLYFTNLPQDNTGAIGDVRYTFLALDGPCSTALTPYQEVASGADNEKFNADFGGGIPPVDSSSATVTIDKNGDATAAEGATATYNIPFANTSDTEAGLTLSSGGVNAPLVVSDTVPTGLEYVCGSASASLDYTPESTPGYEIRYSTDSGSTWSTSEPSSCPTNPTSSGPNNLIMLQWWLTEPLPTQTNNGSGTATFQAVIPNTYISGGGTPVVENCAEGSFGAGSPFDAGCTTTLVQGSLSIGDTVWQDDDGDGIEDAGESGIASIGVSLYYDKDGNGQLDTDTDVLVDTTTTADGSGTDPAGYYEFTQLPNGDYLVEVDDTDTDLPTGYTPTTDDVHAVTLSGSNYVDADFGFAPTLEVNKTLISSDPAYEGENVTFTIDLRNTLPGDGTAGGFCQYTIWASTAHVDGTNSPPGGGQTQKQWQDANNVLGVPDSQYTRTDMQDATELLGVSGFSRAGSGTITKVEALVYFREGQNFVSGSTFTFRTWDDSLGGALGTYTFDDTYFSGPADTTYLIRQDVTADRASWAWSHFVNNTTEMQLEADKGSGSDGGETEVDAVAYVVTTDELCGDEDSTISSLPLTDTFDDTKMQFVSAEPQESSVSGGTITWDNLGPLYAGGTKSITVTFNALVGSGSDTNTATVNNATFQSGRDVNSDSDTATVNFATSGSIAGTVWADTNGTSGWAGSTGYDASDTFVPNATVELYGCFDPISDEVITPPASSTNKPCEDSANGGEWRLVTSQRTDSSGVYTFDGLRDGYYNVKVADTTLPATFTTNSAEADPAGNGSGSTCGGGTTCDDQWNEDTAALSTFNSVVNSPSADNITDVSFGYVDTSGNGAVTGYVWNDRDGDGTWDTGTEEPIAGVTVELDTGSCTLGTDCPSTTTDSDGFYSFGNVTPASGYQVVVTPPSGMSQSGDPDTTLDNQTTSAFTVSANEVEGTYNFGYTGGLTIGDTVYADWDGDGTQDTGEEGLSSVQVYLYRDVDGDGVIDSGDTLLDTQTTDGNGNYTFSNLPGDGTDYIVKVSAADVPAGYVQTGDPDATFDDKTAVTLNSSNVDTADFGYQPQGAGTIGDLVWQDNDADGTDDTTESGVSGVTLTLYQDQSGNGTIDASDDAVVGSTTTDASGIYTFTNLAGGDYVVQADSANFNSGQPLDGLSQTNGSQDNLHSVTLSAGQDYTAADFGYASSIIGDFIWQDNDGDGSQGINEPGIVGVDVTLYVDNDSNGDVSSGDTVYDYDGSGTGGDAGDTIQTDSNGRYEFGSLPAGDYVVVVESSNFNAGGALENYTLTYDPDGYATNGKPFPPCDTTDTDYTDCDNESAATGLTLGQTDRTHDFGYQPQGFLGDTLWIDSNGDGVRDSDESGIANVIVELYDCAGGTCGDGDESLVASTSTDLDGYYAFGGLSSGTYYVAADTTDTDFPSGLANTYAPDSSADNQVDSINIDSSGAVTSIGGSSCTNCNLDIDLGYQYSGAESISGHVFFDAGGTGDGEGDTYEGGTNDSPYEGIAVYLWNSDGNLVGSTTTASDGSYSFSGLPAASFTVSVDKNAPQVSAQTLTATPGSPGSAFNTVTASASNQDFGFNASMDFGDLLDTYHTSLVNEGPYHTINTLYLGTSSAPDAESNGQPTNDATGDGSDEDGVTRDPTDLWQAGNTVDLNVGVTGDGGYLVGWFDWNGDGDFNDANEIKRFGSIPSGTNTISLQVPSGYGTGDIVNTRFRLYDGQPTFVSPTGGATNGEVEDYQWDFGPTSITLTSANTSAPTAGTGLPLTLIASLMAAAGIVILHSRRRE